MAQTYVKSKDIDFFCTNQSSKKKTLDIAKGSQPLIPVNQSQNLQDYIPQDRFDLYQNKIQSLINHQEKRNTDEF